MEPLHRLLKPRNFVVWFFLLMWGAAEYLHTTEAFVTIGEWPLTPLGRLAVLVAGFLYLGILLFHKPKAAFGKARSLREHDLHALAMDARRLRQDYTRIYLAWPTLRIVASPTDDTAFTNDGKSDGQPYPVAWWFYCKLKDHVLDLLEFGYTDRHPGLLEEYLHKRPLGYDAWKRILEEHEKNLRHELVK
jgi:hypothetical protein